MSALTFIQQALALAARAVFVSNPNPRVGCIITNAQGDVLGEGFTQQAGGPHAEIVALRAALAAGVDVRGGTAWVTLEPCAHQGRTGPCCDALAQAGIARVVACVQDPNPLVAGQGFARLRAAGVQLEVGSGAAQAIELNLGFFSRMTRGVPWVRLKVAASLDGTTALHNGASQWITSEAARADGHHWRARACAVLTGVGTLLEDNPRLDVRAIDTPRQPHVVVVDSQLQTPPDAAIFRPDRACWIYAAQAHAERQAALEAVGAEVIYLPNANGQVDLAAMMRNLGQRSINELHVEAGHNLNGSLVSEGLVDEMLVYLAPTLLGPGLGMANMGPLAQLSNGLAMDFTSVQAVGPDLRMITRVRGRDDFAKVCIQAAQGA